MALSIIRDEGQIKIGAGIEYDTIKERWVDGIYFLVSNPNISIWFDKEAEEKLIEFLRAEQNMEMKKEG